MKESTINIADSGFIKKYKLWSASSVVSAAKGLLEKDYITQENGTYMVYDPFFAQWMQRRQ